MFAHPRSVGFPAKLISLGAKEAKLDSLSKSDPVGKGRERFSRENPFVSEAKIAGAR